MLRLLWLKINNFRKVRPGTHLRFGPEINVLLGKNATGKTTLLDLIAAISNDDLSRYAGERAGFDLEWAFSYGPHELQVHFERAPLQSRGPSLEMDIGSELRSNDRFEIIWLLNGEPQGTVRARFVNIEWIPVNPIDGVPDATPKTLDAASLRGAVGWATFFALDQMSAIARARFPHDLPIRGLSRAAVPRLDEALLCFDDICRAEGSLRLLVDGYNARGLSQWIPSSVLDALVVDGDVAPEIAFEGLASAVPLTRIAPEMRDEMAKRLDALRLQNMSPEERVERAVLAALPAALGFARGTILPNIRQRWRDGANTVVTLGGLEFRFYFPDGSFINQDLLSFGQKRFFTFLWYVAARRPKPLVVDELANGLHYEWIERAFEEMRSTQTFLATQHPFLLDHISLESVEDVKNSFIECSIRDTQLVWENLNDDQANYLFGSYKAGIQQLSESLRMWGLW